MLVKVEFASFAVDSDKNTPCIILKESGGSRMLPVPISPLEAGVIAIETLKATPLQPLTIDVVKGVLEKLGGSLKRVILYLADNKRLAGQLEFAAGGSVHHCECRPCDSIALALRCGVPLLVRESVFEKYSAGNGKSEQEKLRAHIAALDTLEFGTVYLE
jgi:uncharacterized protein